jgi:hypothetical protein
MECLCNNCRLNGYEGCPKCDAEEKILNMHRGSTAEKDRHYICEIGKLFWNEDKQCYAADAIYRKVKELLKQVDNHAFNLTKTQGQV